ncbi:MAG TPA: DNA polymerase III subunit delta [Burkholderiales bacterium]|nr:DNA polymerase III subunit delta [Burkholderiales bacterium]
MRITTEQLQPHLRELQPLYTVHGAETLLALEAADRVRAAARSQGYAEREVLTVESGFQWSELAMAGSAQSLFASRKLLELRIPNGKPGVEGGNALQEFCKRLPEETVTLIQLPEIDWRAQKAAWFDALAAAGVMVEARLVTRNALPQWLAGRLKAQKQEADADTLAFIAERVEGNLMAAYQEVQKLALLFPPGRLSFEQAREAVLDVARYDVDEIGLAMLEGDVSRLVRMFEGLKAEGAPPPFALWQLTEVIRALGRVVSLTAGGRPIAVALREARIYGPRQSHFQSCYSRFTPQDIAEALAHAAAIDRIIKGLDKGDLWDELLHLALRFARAGGPATRPRRPAATTA